MNKKDKQTLLSTLLAFGGILGTLSLSVTVGIAAAMGFLALYLVIIAFFIAIVPAKEDKPWG